MNIFICITLLLTISFCLWTTEGRKFKAELTVPNGGPWGDWGKREFCGRGYVRGFQLKVSTKRHHNDEEGLTGIVLFCQTREHIRSSYSTQHGNWKKKFICPEGYLNSFSLRVQPDQGTGDDTAANNIQFTCSDGSTLVGDGMDYGDFGPWSPICPDRSFICGIQTKIQPFQWYGDDTSINDVKFYCC